VEGKAVEGKAVEGKAVKVRSKATMRMKSEIKW